MYIVALQTESLQIETKCMKAHALEEKLAKTTGLSKTPICAFMVREIADVLPRGSVLEVPADASTTRMAV